MNNDHIETLDKAIELFWNFELTECENLLSNEKTKVPLFSLLYTDISFIKAVLTETKEDMSEASKRISECKSLARSLQLSQKPLYLKLEKEEKKSKDSNTKDGADSSNYVKAEYLISKLIYAETLVMKAIIEFKAQNNLKAGLAFRKSWKQYSQAFELVKTLPTTFPIYKHILSCAYYGVGFFHFLVSVVPPQYIWLVEGIGFKGNRMEGLKEIQLSSDSNGIRSNMAKIAIILLNVFFFEDYNTPEPLIKELMTKYENGSLIYYMSGAILRKQGKIKESSVSYQRSYDTSGQLKQLQLFVDSELGYNEFLNLNWEAASVHLAKFLNETTSSGFKAFVAYQLGCCYDMLGKKEEARATFKSLEPWVRKGYDFDDFSQKKAARYLKQKDGWSMFDQLYIQASLLNEAHQFQRSYEYIKQALAIGNLTKEESAVAEYLGGANCQQLGQREEARRHYQQSIANEKSLSYDHFCIPYSYIGLAEIAFADDKKSDAKAFVKKAKGYNSTPYDFPSVLDWRTRKLLQLLGEF
ncbi:hypothetical protein DFA_10791 [Cavenderia fasciculata]|uniref:Tetratricopeptide-like helical domain-containing protein n=1 Tax=Cavenderia fasciculata TaxID=261658 RepID=F4QBE6_CACFS|nr:uncharacterized protein DFA_10791 [Cavenderia fasciculata]EGG14918.1 hypothetical protein DFA_10791 [Cavenderia fasciculata]|eukprot:XP_004351434.1 hypothetical protein DFA_10791 [Cavenderia fasciculata]